MSRLISSIDGPLISTSDIDRMKSFFTGIFDLEVMAEERLDHEAVKALWGLQNLTAQTILLETGNTGVGVRIVQFFPTSGVVIRDPEKGEDCDSLKVMDFIVQNYDDAISRLEENGYHLAGSPAEYDIGNDGRVGEAQVMGPDNVICVLIRLYDSPHDRFVRMTDRLFSEILSFTTIVDDVVPVIDFYAKTMELDTVYQYDFETDTYSRVVGMNKVTKMKGFNFGLSQVDPMIGIADYGLPKGTYRSLKDRAVLPNLGMAGIRLKVNSIKQILKKVEMENLTVCAGPSELDLRPYGKIRSLSIRAPHGVLHQFIEIL